MISRIIKEIQLHRQKAYKKLYIEVLNSFFYSLNSF